MNPEVSIVVPVYNVEKYLTRCIDSILKQTFKNFELILVNDGSTDNSLNICKEYLIKDKRIKLISQTNKGLSTARNTGIKRAIGKYICFIDSDDFVEKDYVRLLLSNIKKYKSDISICEYYLTDATGKKYSIEKLNEPIDISVLSGEKIFYYFYKDNYVPNVVAWNKLYKKSLFKNIKYKEGYYFEDEWIALPLFYKARRISFIRVPLYNYVQRQGSIMNTPLTLKKFQDKSLMYKERIQFFQNDNPVLYKAAAQKYKDWLVEINNTNIDGVSNLKLQSEYRKYFGIRKNNTFKLFLKDIIGSISLGLLYKMEKIKGNINKNI